MSRCRRPGIGWGTLLVAGAALALPAGAMAQGGPGFLFKKPTVTLKLETGYAIRLANSDVYDFTREELTVSRHDFYAPYIGGEIAVRLSERVDLALTAGFMQSEKDSEFRDWVDTNDLPIEQTTLLRTVPFVASAKYYLHDRGRTVGRFAWVPNKFNPYVGAGVGVVSYRFEQMGDFVDFETLDIFYDRFISSGQTGLLRLLGGASVSLANHFETSGELRYSMARDDMGSDFQGFDPLSLSGFEAIIGFAIRF